MSAFDWHKAPRRGERSISRGLLVLAVSALALLAGPFAQAQDAGVAPILPKDEVAPDQADIEGSDGEEIYLDADGFRALFEEKTVHLSYNGEYFGSEYYKKGDKSVWVQVTQPCMPGFWYYEKPYFCFEYGEIGPFCWKVFQRGEDIFAVARNGFELRVDAVDEKPLTCDPELLS